MTYDLLKSFIDAVEAKVDRVEVTALKDQTFFACIHLSCNDQTHQIDARPSDSIALALKTKAKIFVNEELFSINVDDETSESPPMPTDPESLRERLKRINPEDFGKYQL
jgi:bifunctional DNase/RNase